VWLVHDSDRRRPDIRITKALACSCVLVVFFVALDADQVSFPQLCSYGVYLRACGLFASIDDVAPCRYARRSQLLHFE
jgi:hypothetical protein